MAVFPAKEGVGSVFSAREGEAIGVDGNRVNPVFPAREGVESVLTQ